MTAPQVVSTLLVPILLSFAGSGTAWAEFHTWVDSAGRRHVSNVAPPGPDTAAAAQPFRHPHSIAAQHRRLRETLARRDAELARRAARRGEPDASSE